MSYDFDQSPDLRSVYATKWTAYPEDVLPMWIADMDFRSAQPIIDALTERVQFGTFGYTMDYPPLREILVERMQSLYGWAIQPHWIVFIPGIVTTMNMITQALTKAGDGVLMQTPIYPPFLHMPAHNGCFAQCVDLTLTPAADNTYTFTTDFDAFERAITQQTRLFYLCNPHNPGGMVYTRAELERFAQISLQHNLTILADEIHSDLILDGQHTPIASLAPEVEQRTLTLIAPSKTYNLAGLACSIAIIPNDETRKAVTQQVWGTGLHVNLLGLVAADAAYRHAGSWLTATLDYLRGNRDLMVEYLAERAPSIRLTRPQGTYMSYLDLSALPLPAEQSASQFLEQVGRVALNPGDSFVGTMAQRPLDRFVRLNFACPRFRLRAGLERIVHAVESLPVTSG
ncbi:PatB family C-S lyase [Aggregatilineales bacterium SYSU G02658]